MSELKVILATPHPKMKNACDGAVEVYLKTDVDELLTKKNAEIARLIEDWNRLCEKYNKFIKLKQEFCDKFKDIELEIDK